MSVTIVLSADPIKLPERQFVGTTEPTGADKEITYVASEIENYRGDSPAGTI
jgi:hypothetical protein